MNRGRERLHKVRPSHKRGSDLIVGDAKLLKDPTRISYEGIFNGDHPRILKTLEDFAYYIVGRFTASQAKTFWYGAINPSTKAGTLSKSQTRYAHSLITARDKMHIPAERTVIPQMDHTRFRIGLSDICFGGLGQRLTFKQVVFGNLNHYLIYAGRTEFFIRPSEMTSPVKSDPDDRNFFNSLCDIRPSIGNINVCEIWRPKKQHRARGSNKPSRRGTFNREPDRDLSFVSFAYAYDFFIKKTAFERIDLTSRLWAPTPAGKNPRSVISTKDHCAWLKEMARRTGFSPDFAKYFDCRNTRRAAVTSSANLSKNPFIAASIIGHASVDTTGGYHSLAPVEQAAILARQTRDIAENYTSLYVISVIS